MQYSNVTKNTSHLRVAVRIFVDFFLLVAVFVGPWWFAFTIAFILILFFGVHEVVLIGVILDSLYSSGTIYRWLGEYTFTATLCLLISFSYFISPYIRGVGNSQTY